MSVDEPTCLVRARDLPAWTSFEDRTMTTMCCMWGLMQPNMRIEGVAEHQHQLGVGAADAPGIATAPIISTPQLWCPKVRDCPVYENGWVHRIDVYAVLSLGAMCARMWGHPGICPLSKDAVC